MKTARAAAGGRARPHGSRIVLADGRELIDGIASWWTACHGYNHPHIRAAVERQLARDAARDVRRPRARAGADAGAAARGAAAGRSRPRVLLRVRLGRGRGRHEDGGAVLAQPRRARPHAASSPSAAAITATPPARWRSAIRRTACTRCSAGCCREQVDRRPAGATRRARRRSTLLLARHADEHRRHHRRAAGAGRRRHALPRRRGAAAPARRSRTATTLLLIFDEIFTGFGRTGTMFACEAGRRRARHHHAVEGADRRHAAARRDGRAQAGVRGVLVGRSGAGADARPDLHGQCARLRRRQRLARSVRARAAARAGRGDLRRAGATGSRRAAACRASRTCGSRARSAWSSSTASTISTPCAQRFVEEGVFIRPFGSIVYLTPAFTIAEDELARLTDAVRRVVAEGA